MRTSLTARRTLSERVAAEIRAHMGREMVKQSELAKLLNTNDQWLSVRLRGRQPIDLNDLERIANALGMEVADFMPQPQVTTPRGRTRRYGQHVSQTRPVGHPDETIRPPKLPGSRRSVINRARYAA